MAIKDILVLLDPSSEAAGSYALSVTSACEAHLTGAVLVVDPTTIIPFAEMPSGFLAAALDEQRTAARQILEGFASRAQEAGIAVDTEIQEAAVNAIGQTLGAFARYFDLTIIEQPNPDVLTERESAIEAALFASGRPVLVVPYIHKAPLQLEHVLVAWDGSATAARALGDALPLLARAKDIQVVSVVDGNEGTSGPRIVRHLEQHAITAKYHSVPGGDDPTDALLSYAADCCADLLVMGGYGHSRFRELLLGGTTRGILASMTLPVFMSH